MIYPPYNFKALATGVPIDPTLLDDCFAAACSADLSNLSSDGRAIIIALIAQAILRITPQDVTGSQTIDGTSASQHFQAQDTTPVTYQVNSGMQPGDECDILQTSANGQVRLNPAGDVVLDFIAADHIGTGGQNCLIGLRCEGIYSGTTQILVYGATGPSST